MMDLAESETFKTFSVSIKALLFLLKLNWFCFSCNDTTLLSQRILCSKFCSDFYRRGFKIVVASATLR